MKIIIYKTWVKFMAFVLSCFIHLKSSAQDKGPDVFYPCQPSSTNKICFQKINLKTIEGNFPAYNLNFKTPAINFPDTFLSKRSDVPLLRNNDAGIRKKIGRAELFIGGTEVFGATALIAMHNKITKWSPDWELDAWRHMKRSLSRLPVWDNDKWQINYIGHPVAGSIYYNSLRSQDASLFQSFLFATGQSFIWEYIIEATAEKPSTQDLIITPIAGSLLGESIHLITMKMRTNNFNFFEKIFVLIFNPSFVFNNGFGTRLNYLKQH